MGLFDDKCEKQEGARASRSISEGKLATFSWLLMGSVFQVNVAIVALVTPIPSLQTSKSRGLTVHVDGDERQYLMD